MDALIKGRMLAQVDERERNAELAALVRYTIHTKKVKPKTLFDKQKEIGNVDKVFSDASPQKQRDINFAKQIHIVNEHFKNRKLGQKDVKKDD